MRVLFLVPARGGSKGLPGKNLKPLGGIPLVGRATRLARAAGRLLGVEHRVVCSTDDEAIAAAARAWGAEIPFLRPAELASDSAASVDVVLHAVKALQPDRFELVALLQPTSPLSDPADVAGTVRRAVESGAPVVSVCLAEHPACWQFTLDDTGRLSNLLGGQAAARRQDAQAAFRLNGAVYVARPEQIAALRGFIGPETRAFEMPAERSVDIDTPADLAVAQALVDSRPVEPVDVAGRQIGPGHPCFVIAEAGVNHNGQLDLALQLVDAAAAAGADAVKFQTFHAERVVSPTAEQAAYQRENTGLEEPQLAMIRRLELADDAFAMLARHCRERSILFLSSPFDMESVDLLDRLGVPAFKVGSGELTHHALLAHIASKRKPILLSTGMSSLAEVAAALDVIEANGSPPVALLHCVSNYPAAPADCNLAAIATMRSAFQTPVGWSDHTMGTEVALAAVARGANLVEKHFTLDRGLPGPDHRASLEPAELRALVAGIRNVELAIGHEMKARVAAEESSAALGRRSLFSARALAQGHMILECDLIALRPGTGIPADQLGIVAGRHLRRGVAAGTMLRLEDLEQ